MNDDLTWGDHSDQVLPDVSVTDGSLRFEVRSFFTGCRNWTPPQFLACAEQDGVTFQVAAPGVVGCESIPEVALDIFTELLAGIRLAQ